MDSTRKLLLGMSGAAVGALLGVAMWHVVIPAGRRSATVHAASPAAEAQHKPPSAAEQELQTLLRRIDSEVKHAPDRQEVAQKAIKTLQQFIEQHASDPVADKARLGVGNMQLIAGQTRAALVTFQHVADHPTDPQILPVALFFLGKTQVALEHYEEAQATFQKLRDREKDSRYGAIAKAALAMLAVRPGQRPPSFLMKDLTGHSQSPELYRGKVLLIDFWATWCAPCRQEMDNLKDLYHRYHGRGLNIVGVSLDTDPDAMQKFLQEQGIAWPQIFDGRGPKGELPRQMGVVSIPRMILIDRQGIIRTVSTGGPTLESSVREVLDARANG